MAETLCVNLRSSAADGPRGTERSFRIDGEPVRVVMVPV